MGESLSWGSMDSNNRDNSKDIWSNNRFDSMDYRPGSNTNSSLVCKRDMCLGISESQQEDRYWGCNMGLHV
jgi:hypothetical protein